MAGNRRPASTARGLRLCCYGRGGKSGCGSRARERCGAQGGGGDTADSGGTPGIIRSTTAARA
eukprot:3367957-Prymnesium_polylepis.1